MRNWPNTILSDDESKILAEFRANATLIVGVGFICVGGAISAGYVPHISKPIFFGTMAVSFVATHFAANYLFKVAKHRQLPIMRRLAGLTPR